MKVDVSELKYEQIAELVGRLPFELRNLSRSGGRVLLDLAVPA